MHEKSHIPHNVSNDKQNNKDDNNYNNNDKNTQANQTGHNFSPKEVTDKLNRIFHVLDQFRNDLTSLKAQTKALYDEIDNVKLQQQDHDARINNLEYKLECETLGPDEQGDGQVENYTNYISDPSLLNFNEMNDQYHEDSRQPKRQRYIPSDPFNNVQAPPLQQINALNQKNESLENQLNEVLDVLKQIQDSVPTQQ
jgi:hypothetical protein